MCWGSAVGKTTEKRPSGSLHPRSVSTRLVMSTEMPRNDSRDKADASAQGRRATDGARISLQAAQRCLKRPPGMERPHHPARRVQGECRLGRPRTSRARPPPMRHQNAPVQAPPHERTHERARAPWTDASAQSDEDRSPCLCGPEGPVRKLNRCNNVHRGSILKRPASIARHSKPKPGRKRRAVDEGDERLFEFGWLQDRPPDPHRATVPDRRLVDGGAPHARTPGPGAGHATAPRPRG